MSDNSSFSNPVLITCPTKLLLLEPVPLTSIFPNSLEFVIKYVINPNKKIHAVPSPIFAVPSELKDYFARLRETPVNATET